MRASRHLQPVAPVRSRPASRLPATPEPDITLPDVLGSEIANILERRIIYLDIAPDARVTEQEVCDEFNISRSPVREAFRQLEATGLVVRLARRGIRVKELSVADLDDIYACRTPLEGIASGLAAKRATKEDLATMQGHLKAMQAALKAGNVREFFLHNVGFLTSMHEAAGNKMLVRILSVIEKQAMRYRYLAHIEDETMLALVHQGLTEVYAAMVARQPAKAKAALVRTMMQAQKTIRGVLRRHPMTLGAAADD
ncbi:GntR family transcriptional regulator [Xanthobacter dioxanivorans]|uniref:GntR family transcriptional regulator n=1 Tax=Xanthobacter dioxanivorans TaxID=2528964 RepID=A0A974PNZ5_9HYPH|nr:GntR family transcriptional regulator [Xanthobacter dioxanivorans]QRG07093.1 GntR family transcriptional regulator [Xanthobacter dioxanivorans]